MTPHLPLMLVAAILLAPLQSPLAAEEPPKAAEQATPPAPATIEAAERARLKTQEQRAAMSAERDKRYAELRASAAELGVELPETPPWSSARPTMPAPDHPSQRTTTPEEMEAIRQELAERREAHWRMMREGGGARGSEAPSTPAREELMKRRQEMDERYQRYRETVERMTDEQREAARAIFGHPPGMPWTGAPWDAGRVQPGWESPYQGAPGTMPLPPMMPGHQAPPVGSSGYDLGPPPPPPARQGD